jgi:hypothetical protein
VRLVRTDIAGFFGFAERGPVPDPAETDPGKRAQAAVKLTSWNDFRLIFGGFLPYSYLGYAVRGFFATGGKTCYVVRVGVAATPPATAILPLPAAITSSLAAHLAAAAAPGESQIKLDSAVTLTVGSSIAVGDPSFSQRLIVASVIGQTISVQPSLAAAHAAGDPVYALSGPGVAPRITTIAAVTAAGATRIQLGSSNVTGIDVGRLIAIGDPVKGECVAVTSVVDDQTITVQPALESVHAASDPVYAIEGSALTAAATTGATSFQVSDGSAFAPGDLVSVEGGGVTEVRVVTAAPAGSTIQLGRALGFDYDAGAVVRKYTAALTVSAFSPGAWGNGIKLEVTPLDPGNAVTRFSLRVTVDRGADPAQPPQEEFYPLLSLDPQDPYPLLAPDVQNPSPSAIYAPQVVNEASELIQIYPALPQTIVPGTQLLVNSGLLETNDLYLEGGSDGTPATVSAATPAPAPNPCIGKTAAVAVSSPKPHPSPPPAGNPDFLDALEVLGLVDEIAILCCPDAAGPPPQTPVANGWSMTTIQQAMVAQCARMRYRVAVLDTPESVQPPVPLQPAQALSWLNQQGYSGPAARYAAVYYPWLKVPDELEIEGPNRTVPPCGHVAGAYAYTDNRSGVQKPPANVELQFVSDVELAVTNQQQGFLNPAGINAIRAFPGRGIRVWGARSIVQPALDPDWIYIHTRRLMSMIENSVEKASQWVVFRTNDDNLRRMLRHSLNVFLKGIWLAGGLKGARPGEGYFVKCDRTNNPQSSIDAGLLICQIGVAVAAPMEFLVFELRRSVAGAQVVEA